jgi:hypothetical protein
MPPAAPDADDVRRAFDGGADKVVALIRGVPDPAERRRLFGIAARVAGDRSDPARDFDALIAIIHAGVEDALAQAAAETDPTEAARRTEFADALAYDLSDNLAPFRPGDTAPRERRHFEAGLAAAQDCVRRRDDLGKPASSRFAAWWMRGVHQLALGRDEEAAASFERALDLARKAARGAPAAVVRGGDLDVVLSSACLGLATKSRLFDEACDALRTTSARDTGVAAETAAVALAQMRWFARRLAEMRA